MTVISLQRLLVVCLGLAYCFSLCAVDPLPSEKSQSDKRSHILYLMHRGETEQALKLYQEHHKNSQIHDFELLEQLGLILLDQGHRSGDPETQLLTLFGAGISANEKALYIVEAGIDNPQPELQLISLSLLSRFSHDRADQALYRAMTSRHLLIRLEAAMELTANKDPKAVGQVEALMSKLPVEIWPIFPQIFAASGSPEAKKILRKMLANPNEDVRIATILSVGEAMFDDFLPVIRRLASHHEPAQQEACAVVLGVFKDETSVPRLLQLAKSPHLNVRLAALKSLYQLGREEVVAHMEALIDYKDPFVLSLAGSIPGTENALAKLITNEQLQVRSNAAIALLERGDARCVKGISELILSDSRDLGLMRISSQGRCLKAWKVIPSVHHNFKDNPAEKERALHQREELLLQSVELPEEHFINIATAVFENQQNDLVPALVRILESHPTPAVINLLKKYQQKTGAPLIRNYCNLALYRMKQEGPYAENLRAWVTQQRNIDLITFRPLVPHDSTDHFQEKYDLTPQETSRLLVEAFESFVELQDDKGVDMLISVIQNGNPKNKYGLIGLLMRTIQ